MQLKLIIYCVLLFCLEFSASVESNSQKQSGIYNIRPPYAASRQRAPRSYQAWNERRPYQLPPQYQPPSQTNREWNVPNNFKKPVPNFPYQIPQARFTNGYPNQHRIPNNIGANFPNIPNQVKKVINVPDSQKASMQNNPHNLLVAKLQPNSPYQFKQQIAGNPAVLKQTVPRIAEHILPTKNEAKIVNVSVPKLEKRNSFVSRPEAGVRNEYFTPLIPSRPIQASTPSTGLTEHKVKIIPSIEIKEENKIPLIAPVHLEDRYLASASNPVETITRKLIPPYYNIKHFASNPNIRNVLATTKHKKRYLVIHPNGTIEHVEKLETVAQSNPNYVLIQAGDIISNPIQKVEKVQEVVAKPVNSNSLHNVIVNTPVASPVIPPIIKQTSTTPTNDNQNKLAQPVSIPPKTTSINTPKVAKLPISAGNVAAKCSIQKVPIASQQNKTSPSVTPSNIKIIFSKPSTNIKNTDDDSSEGQIHINKIEPNVLKPVFEEIKLLADLQNPIVKENYENKKPIIIYGENVTGANDQEAKIPATLPPKPVKTIPSPESTVKEIIVKDTVQPPSKVNDPTVVEAVAVTKTKPTVIPTLVTLQNKEKDSTPVDNEAKLLPIVNNKTVVNEKPSKDKSDTSPAASIAKVNLIPPVKAEAVVKSVCNLTEAKSSEKKQPSINQITQTKIVDKEEQKPIKTPSDDKLIKNYTAIPSKPEDKEEKHITESLDAEPDENPLIWFRTSDPGFWDKLKGDDKDDVVYFFQIHNRPKVETNTTRTIFPNGTVFEETTKYLWEIEGETPIITKSTQIIEPENAKS